MSSNNTKFRDQLAEGCIMEVYTRSDFVKVYPAFGIDKIQFSFVKIGSGGQEKLDVYVGLNEFNNLCENIEDKSFQIALRNDKEQYPSAWKINTGTKGTKHVAVGTMISQKDNKPAIFINGSDGASKKRFFVMTTYADLQNMAFWFDIASGKRQVSGYYAELLSILQHGMKERAKYRGNVQVDEDYNEQTEEDDIADGPAPSIGTNSFAEKATGVSIETSVDKETFTNKPHSEVRMGRFKTCSRVMNNKMFYRVEVIPTTGMGDKRYLFIPMNGVADPKRFDKFIKSAERGEQNIVVNYTSDENGNMQFVSFPNSN